jgi:Zn-dependent protease with chaperone function
MPTVPDSGETVAKALSHHAYQERFPDSPLPLQDSRLLDYRHPTERWMLLLALLVVAVLIISGVWFGERDILLAVGAVYISMLFTALQAKTNYRLQGAEVTATQFPAIHNIVEELRARFHAPPTRVFVVRKLSLEAETFGLSAPYVIVLTSALLDSMEPDELRYALGRAFGHICFGHTRIALLMGGEESTLPAVLSWVAWLRDLIFAGYWRAETLSGDRAGILACRSITAAFSAQLKISVGTNQAREIRIEDMLDQAVKLRRTTSRIQAMFIRSQNTAPPLIPRLEAMLLWAGRPPKARG